MNLRITKFPCIKFCIKQITLFNFHEKLKKKPSYFLFINAKFLYITRNSQVNHQCLLLRANNINF